MSISRVQARAQFPSEYPCMAVRHAAIGILQSIPRTRWLGGYTVFGHSGGFSMAATR
jgi:hypothetical protein